MAMTPLPPVADAEPISALAAVFANAPDAHLETQANRWLCENETTLFEAASTTASPAQMECQPDVPEEDGPRRSCSNSVSPLVIVRTPSGDNKYTSSKLLEDTSPAVSPRLWPLGGPEAEPSPVLCERFPAAEPPPRSREQQVTAELTPPTRERLSAVELSSMPSPERVQPPAVLVSSPRRSSREASSNSGNEEVQWDISHTLVADTGLDFTFSKTPSLTQASRRMLSRSISPIARQKMHAEQVVTTCSEGCGPQETLRPRDETGPQDVFLQPPRPSPLRVGVGPRSVSPIKCMPRRQGSFTASSPAAPLQSPAAMKLKFGPEAEPSPVLAETHPRTRMLASERVTRASTYDLSSTPERSPRPLQRQCSKPEDGFCSKDTRKSLLAIQEKVAKYEQLLDQVDLALKQPENASGRDCNAGASPTEHCLELAVFLQRLSDEERALLRFMPLSRWSDVRRRELRQRCMTRGLNFGRCSTGDGRDSWGSGAVGIVRGTLVQCSLLRCV